MLLSLLWSRCNAWTVLFTKNKPEITTMAILTAPLLSVTAKQTFAKTITYFRRNGQNLARQWIAPTNPSTPGQLVQRALFAAISKYRNLYIAVQEGLNHYAKSLAIGLTGPGYWQGTNLKNVIAVQTVSPELAGAAPIFLFWDGIDTTSIGLVRIDTRLEFAASAFTASLQCFDTNGATIETFYSGEVAIALESDSAGANAVDWAHGAFPAGTAALKYVITIIYDTGGEIITQPHDYVISGPMSVFD